MENRYIIFKYDDYYPLGGHRDVIGSARTILEASEIIESNVKKQFCDYEYSDEITWEIYDTQKMALVCYYRVEGKLRGWYVGVAENYSIELNYLFSGIPTDNEWSEFMQDRDPCERNVIEFAAMLNEKYHKKQ